MSDSWAYARLDRVHSKVGITCVIEGGARGADRIGRHWAIESGIQVITEPADWGKHGKAAGYIRNKSMLVDHSPDYVIAMPGGAGTANMCAIAKSAGVPRIYLERVNV